MTPDGQTDLDVLFKVVDGTIEQIKSVDEVILELMVDDDDVDSAEIDDDMQVCEEYAIRYHKIDKEYKSFNKNRTQPAFNVSQDDHSGDVVDSFSPTSENYTKSEVENAEERIALAVEGFGMQKLKDPKHNIPQLPQFTTAELVNTDSKKQCNLCEGNHHTDSCCKAKKVTSGVILASQNQQVMGLECGNYCWTDSWTDSCTVPKGN